MTEEQSIIDAEQLEEANDQTTTEEFKIQVEDLIEAVKKLVHKGTVRRVMVLRNDRVLVDIPLVAGVAAGVVLGIYLPVLSAIMAAGALLGGVTVRVEHDELPEDSESEEVA
jgi:hypothetical protein